MTSYQTIPHHVLSYLCFHNMLYDTLSFFLYHVMWNDIISDHTTPYPIKSYRIILHHITPFRSIPLTDHIISRSIHMKCIIPTRNARICHCILLCGVIKTLMYLICFPMSSASSLLLHKATHQFSKLQLIPQAPNIFTA